MTEFRKRWLSTSRVWQTSCSAQALPLKDSHGSTSQTLRARDSLAKSRFLFSGAGGGAPESLHLSQAPCQVDAASLDHTLGAASL